MILFTCTNVGLQYPGNVTPAFCRVSLTIAAGDCLQITGPSGSGKTSLMRVIAGLTQPTSGDVLTRPRRVGMAFAEPRLIGELSVMENLHFVAPNAKAEARALLEALDLAGLAESTARVLSKGQAQRVALIRALLVHPEILLLDEALGGLDLPTWTLARDQVLEHHKKENLSIVEISHDTSRFIKNIADTLMLTREVR